MSTILTTKTHPELAKLLRGLCLCPEESVDTHVLVLADWLEEQGDERSGRLRELVRDLGGGRTFTDREMADLGVDQVRGELLLLALRHGCAYVDQVGDPENRRQRFLFRTRDAALRRFSVVAEQIKGSSLHTWFLEEPERDLVAWDHEAIRKNKLHVEVDRPKRKLVRLFQDHPSVGFVEN